MVNEETRRKVIISILNVNSQKGATLLDIKNGYMEMEGEYFAKSREEAIEVLKNIEGVIFYEGRYYARTEKSAHIAVMVENQKPKAPNSTQSINSRPKPQQNRSYQNSHCNRSLVSYSDVNNFNPNGSAPGPSKIQKRRNTTYSEFRSWNSDERFKRRNSVDQDENKAKRFKKSRSKSPEPRRLNENVDRPSSRGSNHRSRSRSPSNRYRNENRSRYDQRDRSPNRTETRHRSRSRRSSRSPPRDRRTSPKRRTPPKSARSNAIPQENGRSSRTPPIDNQPKSPDEKTLDTTACNGHNLTPNLVTNSSTPLPGQVRSSMGLKTETKMKRKKFKFTVIGDGFIYYMISDMQDEDKPRMAFCDHSKTFNEAIEMLNANKDRLQERKKKVLISLGATDIRRQSSFGQMKQDFTSLFLRCDQFGLKPLITTVLCFDSPELKTRADCFNRFLMENFENVIDMREVTRCGLTEVLTTCRYKFERKKSLQIGTQQQLILNFDK